MKKKKRPNRRTTGRTAKKRKKGVNGKEKGNRAERAVAKLFASWWGADFARTPQSGGFRTQKFRQDWNAEGDLVTPDESFPFSVECKWHEDWTLDKLITATEKTEIWQWWKQTLDQTADDKIPLLVFKRNNMPWYYMTLSKHSHDIPGRFLVTTDPDLSSVTVGLLSDLFATEKSQWLNR